MLIPIPTGKTGEALVTRISNAIGVVFEPHRMRREASAKIDVAKAEVQAEIIRAEGRLQISAIEARGLQRLVYEAGKDQENIEAVTVKAIPHLSADAKPEELDEDFVRYLFDKAKMVSNQEMQSVWAKILAGEANQAGSFSRRTMDIVSQMNKAEAELFTRFCRNLWIIEGYVAILPKTIPNPKDDGFSMSFGELQHLDSIGLVHFDGTSPFVRNGLPAEMQVSYYGCPVQLQFPNEDRNSLIVGKARLTATGYELAPIAGSMSSVSSFENALRYMIEQKIRVSIPIDAKAPYLAVLNDGG